MERSIQKNGLINLLVLLGVGVAGLAAARYANSLAGQVSILFLGIGVLVAVVSWFQMRLEDRERLEKLEAKLSFLYRSLGVTAQEAPDWRASPALLELVKKGDKIAAIKAFREETGASLKDAKGFVESLVI